MLLRLLRFLFGRPMCECGPVTEYDTQGKCVLCRREVTYQQWVDGTRIEQQRVKK